MRTRSGRDGGDRRDGSDRRSPEPQGKFASPLHFGGLHFGGGGTWISSDWFSS